MSYTKGPWEVAEGNFIVTQKDRHIVAEVPCQGANDNDLPLIASAPDLLEACKEMVYLLEDKLVTHKSGECVEYMPTKEKLEQAIAKAEK